jgi:hypothetical protein
MYAQYARNLNVVPLQNNLQMSLHHHFILGSGPNGQQYISKSMKNIKETNFRYHGSRPKNLS